MSRLRSRSLGDQRPVVSSIHELLRAQTEMLDVSRAGPSGIDRISVIEPQVPERPPDEAPPAENLAHGSGWILKNILTCDGGGIRGYASVLMIEALMKQIGILEREHAETHQTSFKPGDKPVLPGMEEHDDGSYYSEYLPCHYFDSMMGTSTGGLIAVMLSRWRMSARECRERYEAVGRSIFAHRRRFGLGGIIHDKHHKRFLIEAIEALKTQKTPQIFHGSGRIFERFPSSPGVCQVAVFANEETRYRRSRGAYIFRSYKPDFAPILSPEDEDYPLNPLVGIDHEIWRVCRATTAAPTFFRPQEIDGRFYSDGGVGINNPTDRAIDEIDSLKDHTVKNVVSFGTGKPARRSERTESAIKKLRLVNAATHLNTLFKTAKAGLTDCERTHRAVARLASRSKTFEYFRFNVAEGLGKTALDECEPDTLQNIHAATVLELKKPEVKAKLRALAVELVAQRRERIKHYPSYWERFSLCTKYICQTEDCGGADSGTHTTYFRHGMEEHLRNTHVIPGESFAALQARLDLCRKGPEFPVGPW